MHYALTWALLAFECNGIKIQWPLGGDVIKYFCLLRSSYSSTIL